MSQESAILVNLGILLVARSTIGGGLLRDLVETIVDCFTLRQVREKAPCDDLAGISSRVVEALVLGHGAIVPFEGAAEMCQRVV